MRWSVKMSATASEDYRLEAPITVEVVLARCVRPPRQPFQILRHAHGVARRRQELVQAPGEIEIAAFTRHSGRNTLTQGEGHICALKAHASWRTDVDPLLKVSRSDVRRLALTVFCGSRVTADRWHPEGFAWTVYGLQASIS